MTAAHQATPNAIVPYKEQAKFTCKLTQLFIEKEVFDMDVPSILKGLRSFLASFCKPNLQDDKRPWHQ